MPGGPAPARADLGGVPAGVRAPTAQGRVALAMRVPPPPKGGPVGRRPAMRGKAGLWRSSGGPTCPSLKSMRTRSLV